MISVTTLDANSIRVGLDYCRSLYYANDDTVSVTCSATTFSLLALGDGLAVVVLYATSVLGKRCVPQTLLRLRRETFTMVQM